MAKHSLIIFSKKCVNITTHAHIIGWTPYKLFQFYILYRQIIENLLFDLYLSTFIYLLYIYILSNARKKIRVLLAIKKTLFCEGKKRYPIFLLALLMPILSVVPTLLLCNDSQFSKFIYQTPNFRVFFLKKKILVSLR